jgi:hypothetical protein
LGLHGSGGCEHCSGENEFDQSFHILILLFLLFWRPVIEQPSPTSSQSVSDFLQLFQML